MARGAVIERDELFETANRLEAEGKPVTALTLHQALGRGSLTTIYKYLEAWKGERPAKVTAGTSSDLPEVVKNAFASTWRVATVEAAKETTAVREKAAEEIKEAQKQFAEALEAIERLETDIEAGNEKIETLTARVTELETMATQAQSDSAAHKASAEQLKGQVKSLEAELARMHKDFDHERKDRDRAITEAAELRGQISALTAQNTELLSRLAEGDFKPKGKGRS